MDVFHRGDTSYLVFDRNLAKLSLPIADVRAAQLRDVRLVWWPLPHAACLV